MRLKYFPTVPVDAVPGSGSAFEARSAARDPGDGAALDLRVPVSDGPSGVQGRHVPNRVLPPHPHLQVNICSGIAYIPLNFAQKPTSNDDSKFKSTPQLFGVDIWH